MLDDFTIIHRVLDGDRQAFAELVSRYQRTVYRLTRNLCHSHADAEELTQETFLAAFRHLARFSPTKGQFTTWIMRIARNLSINFLAKKKPLTNSTDIDSVGWRAPHSSLEAAESMAEMDRMFARLPIEQRTALVLIEIEGMTYEEASEIEAVPIGTIKSRVSRAKSALRHHWSTLAKEPKT